MNNGFLVSMSAVATFCIGILIVSSQPAEWISRITEFVKPRDSVLVLIVGSKSGVQRVRAAISDDRVVAETEGAFALRSRRIVAESPEAASDSINQLGWIDKEIELIAVPMARGLAWEKNRHKDRNAQDGDPVDAAQAKRIAELMSKPTLTAGETMAVLAHMDKTGQF